MPDKRVYIGTALVLLAGGAIYFARLFSSSSIIPDDQLQEFVYVDTKTGEAFLLRARASPEYNPETGEPTLIPGLYCDQCRAWRAVGPLEMLQTSQSRPRCPLHKCPLTQDGPLPDPLE
ncbi:MULTISPECIES: hypothetical protein [unclassified Schlesneria]|uniref:hypothetical protein n=1 Tax=Schlesneria TaxID=656899 RepID=UPI002EE85829